MKKDELVLGISTRRLMAAGAWQGVLHGNVRSYLSLIGNEGEFRLRETAEDDPTWKQVIPYLVLHDEDRIFLMRRTKVGRDERLRERWTIGIGGHINPGDGDIVGGLRREWREELKADFEPDFELLGLLNDDSDPVGTVHVGVIFRADARGRPVAVRETDKLEGAFVTPAQAMRVYDVMETWSSLLLDYLMERTPGSKVEGPKRSQPG
jgi:predicted NUDIX family phosphoesterase